MEIDLINKLVTDCGFGLRSWNDRYCKGVWVCVAPNSYLLSEVEEASDAGDLDMIPATEFLESQDWLPFAIGNSFIDGLRVLEERLRKLPISQIEQHSKWSAAVHEVLVHLREVTNLPGCIEGKFKTLSNDFEKIWD